MTINCACFKWQSSDRNGEKESRQTPAMRIATIRSGFRIEGLGWSALKSQTVSGVLIDRELSATLCRPRKNIGLRQGRAIAYALPSGQLGTDAGALMLASVSL